MKVAAVDHELELAGFEVAGVAAADLLGGLPGHAASVKRRLAPGPDRSRFHTSKTMGAGERIRAADRPLTSCRSLSAVLTCGNVQLRRASEP